MKEKDIEKELKKRIYEAEIMLDFIEDPAYQLLVELLNKRLNQVIKEEDKQEGNKDFLTGKACGIKVFFDTVDKLKRYGEEAKLKI